MGVGEMRVPVESVVDGVVDAAAVFPAESDIQGSDAIVLQKRGVVRTRTQCRNAQVRALADFLALLRGFRASDFMQAAALPSRKVRLPIRNVARHAVAELPH